ncbi:hemerythrin domain-containing protein [Streptomyces sp. enrichment culture]|uniref:hemerythrin domain-containing protein n=1 Tax=Streptomyces sp. enrichment culture TaxID=1795815 RepID=UPI003F5565E1
MNARAQTSSAPAVDLTMMYAIHHAFRRDLRLLEEAQHDDLAAFRQGWQRFKTYLTIHHLAEDHSLWPVLRTKLAGQKEALEMLQAMEIEHAQLDTAVEKIDAALGRQGGERALPDLMEDVAACLLDHLDHEEAQALPLVESELSAAEWDAFVTEQRTQVGIKGAATFFPWLLDGVPEDERRNVLDRVPAPLRLVYRGVWRPRYERNSPWKGGAAAS